MGLLRTEHDDLRALLVEAISQHIPGFNTGVEHRAHPLRRQRQKVLRLCLTGMAEATETRHRGGTSVWDWGPNRELGRMECRYGHPLSEILRPRGGRRAPSSITPPAKPTTSKLAAAVGAARRRSPGRDREEGARPPMRIGVSAGVERSVGR